MMGFGFRVSGFGFRLYPFYPALNAGILTSSQPTHNVDDNYALYTIPARQSSLT